MIDRDSKNDESGSGRQDLEGKSRGCESYFGSESPQESIEQAFYWALKEANGEKSKIKSFGGNTAILLFCGSVLRVKQEFGGQIHNEGRRS